MSEYTPDWKRLLNQAELLFLLAQTDMTLPELKILCVFMDKIDICDENIRTVQLEKKELEFYLGLSRIRESDFRDRLQNLMRDVKIEGKTEVKDQGLKLVSLFEDIDVQQDADGVWLARLTCTKQARKALFSVDNIHTDYLRSFISNARNITSRYSYVMYLYLELNRYKKSWDVDLSELRIILQCNADIYKPVSYTNLTLPTTPYV